MSVSLSVVPAAPVFHCATCGQTSHGPFVTHGVGGPVEWPPRCRNDACAGQWWNRGGTSLFDAVKHITRAHDGMTDLAKLQALAKKPL